MAEPPKLLDRVRIAIRTRHHSRRTEEAYVGWIKTTMIYTHVLQRAGGRGIRSPLDNLDGGGDR